MAELKPRQLALIEAMLAKPMESDVKLAEELKINRNTIRVWKQQPEFKEELDKRLKERWKDSERVAMETMQNLARNGDFRASKYILDSLDYAPTQKIEADVNTDIHINIEE